MAFRRTKKLTSFLKFNMSSSGPSFTLGRKGFGVTLGPRGTYLHTGIPGTGLYSRRKISNKDFNFNIKTNYEVYEFNYGDAICLVINLFCGLCLFAWTLQIPEFFLKDWINILVYIVFAIIYIALAYKLLSKLFASISDVEKAAYLLVRYGKQDFEWTQIISRRLEVSNEYAKELIDSLFFWGAITQSDSLREKTLVLHSNSEVKKFFKKIKKDPNIKQKNEELGMRILLKKSAYILAHYKIADEYSINCIERELNISKEQANTIVGQLTTIGIIAPPDLFDEKRVLVRSDEKIDRIFTHIGKEKQSL